MVWITVGAVVCEKDIRVVPVDLELDLGHGGEPLHASHVALRDGVVAAAGPSHPELVLAQFDSEHKIIKTSFPVQVLNF